MELESLILTTRKRRVMVDTDGSVAIDGKYMNGKNRAFYYVSDIHLNNKWGYKRRRAQLIDDVAYELYDCREKREKDAFFLYLGDTADSVTDCCLFYTKMRELLETNNMVAILGNHEIWNEGEKAKSYSDIVDEYRRSFEKCGVILLNDDLMVIRRSERIL